MIYHELEQGTPEWHAYRLEHFNASDAPAMLGVSAHETRTQLLHRLGTGITPEVDVATQRRFDDGHRFEALARPIAESIIGEELYPVVGSEGKLSASFDGLTMDESICFEHKTLNDKLRGIQSSDDLPAQYHAQIEQQLMVSGANKCLFMASKWDGDELVEEVHIWVTHNQDMSNALAQGWTQFSIDLAEYKRKLAAGEIEPPKVEVVAAPVMGLPALSIQVNGSISLITNLQKFGARLNEFVANINKEPSDDQGFADAEQAIKTLQNAQDALEAAESNALAQTSDIDEMRKTVKLYADTARTTRLMLEKMVKARKESIRLEIVSAAGVAFTEHVKSLEAETRPISLSITRPDFAAAIKGKRTIASLRDAVDTALANGKISADAIAKDVRAKLAWCKESSAGFGFLFSDLSALIANNGMEAFQAIVTARIEKHKADEAERIEAETARIQAEATAKAEREAAAKMAQEEARIRAEEQAKVRAEAAEQAKVQAGMAKAQAEEDALVAKQCGAGVVAVDCNKPEQSHFDSVAPHRSELIELVADTYNVSLSLAEEWLCAEFAEV